MRRGPSGNGRWAWQRRGGAGSALSRANPSRTSFSLVASLPVPALQLRGKAAREPRPRPPVRTSEERKCVFVRVPGSEREADETVERFCSRLLSFFPPHPGRAWAQKAGIRLVLSLQLGLAVNLGRGSPGWRGLRGEAGA